MITWSKSHFNNEGDRVAGASCTLSNASRLVKILLLKKVISANNPLVQNPPPPPDWGVLNQGVMSGGFMSANRLSDA